MHDFIQFIVRSLFWGAALFLGGFLLMAGGLWAFHFIH